MDSVVDRNSLEELVVSLQHAHFLRVWKAFVVTLDVFVYWHVDNILVVVIVAAGQSWMLSNIVCPRGAKIR